MRSVFFGSGDFALVVLRTLMRAGRPPVLVVTQPPRRRGRGRRAEPTCVEREARGAEIPVATPEDVNAPESLSRLRNAEADLFLVAEYGQILSKALLVIPRRDALNVHASLLPRHRGASPVAAAILAGDEETGVTIQRVVKRLDAGPILAERATRIGAGEDSGSLGARLAAMGADLLVEVVSTYEAGAAPRAVAQEEEKATYCRKLDRVDRSLDWSRPAPEVVRRIRAFSPTPGARTVLLRTPPLGLVVRSGSEGAGEGAPGTVLGADGEALLVAAGSGAVRLLQVVPAGKRAMTGAAFFHGFHLRAGEGFSSGPERGFAGGAREA